MNAVFNFIGVSSRWEFFNDLEVSVAWSWDEWGLGLATELACLGMAALILGPLHVQFDWSIL